MAYQRLDLGLSVAIRFIVTMITRPRLMSVSCSCRNKITEHQSLSRVLLEHGRGSVRRVSSHLHPKLSKQEKPSPIRHRHSYRSHHVPRPTPNDHWRQNGLAPRPKGHLQSIVGDDGFAVDREWHGAGFDFQSARFSIAYDGELDDSVND